MSFIILKPKVLTLRARVPLTQQLFLESVGVAPLAVKMTC